MDKDSGMDSTSYPSGTVIETLLFSLHVVPKSTGYFLSSILKGFSFSAKNKSGVIPCF